MPNLYRELDNMVRWIEISPKRFSLMAIAGYYIQDYGYKFQENIYGESNEFQEIERAYSNQTSMTNYGLGLMVIGAGNFTLGLQEKYYKNQGEINKARLCHLGMYLLPVGFIAANTTAEIIQSFIDPKIDNHGMDILMGIIAGLQGLATVVYADVANYRNSKKSIACLMQV